MKYKFKECEGKHIYMENKVKISTQNLNLYYGENHALKISTWIFTKIRSQRLLDHPDAENPPI